MSANASAPLILSPVVVYTTLAVYGVLIGGVVLFVYRKFSGAAMLLSSLKQDWASAETTHRSFLDQAKEQVSKLAPAPSTSVAAAAAVGTPRSVTFDTRNQVIAMGRKGFSTPDIARACAMPEADVDVLLGLARIQR